MKILAINGSPRMNRGNTDRILAPLLDGARHAGAEIELYYLKMLKIQPCSGCLSCWFRSPGVCAINDDIRMLWNKLMESDVVILATPLYLFAPSGYMKIAIERLFFPLTTHEYLMVDDRIYHPVRFPDKKWKIMMIASAAFDGEDIFKPLEDMYTRAIHNVVDCEGNSAFVPMGFVTVGFADLFMDGFVKSKCGPLFDSLKAAGREMVQQGCITTETMDIISNPLYYHAGLTRAQAIDRTNRIINQYKSGHIACAP